VFLSYDHHSWKGFGKDLMRFGVFAMLLRLCVEGLLNGMM
jgi:hypothetical protein